MGEGEARFLPSEQEEEEEEEEEVLKVDGPKGKKEIETFGIVKACSRSYLLLFFVYPLQVRFSFVFSYYYFT